MKSILQLLFLNLFACSLSLSAIDLNEATLELATLRKSSLQAETFQERREYNKRFQIKLKEHIENKSYLITDSIPNLGVLSSPDKEFSIYNWNLVDDYEQFEYYAFIVLKNGDILELIDESNSMSDAISKKTPLHKWYGALYYEIIPTKTKKKEFYYVLLGWDGKSAAGTRKVIDVLQYDEELQNWFLGKKIFGPPFANQTRYFIEYSSEVVVSLKYEEKSKMIVFDHLVPQNPGLEGVFDYYVPDFSFDAFQFRKDRWYFIQNVDVRGDQTMENYTDPNKGNRPR